MKTYENQKIITIEKAGADSRRLTAYIDMDALDKAAALNNVVFKLWLYLDKNANKYQFALSCADFCRWANTSASTFHRAVTELKDKGYLVQEKTNNNLYTFYEYPSNAQIGDLNTITVQPSEAKKKEHENDDFVF